jgi:hypothetical protein
LRSILKRIAILVGLAVALVYAGDYGWLRYRMGNPKVGDAFGTVTVYYATELKNGRAEFYFDQPQNQTCTHSLFPHLGYTPCWYAKRKSVRIIGVVVSPL